MASESSDAEKRLLAQMIDFQVTLSMVSPTQEKKLKGISNLSDTYFYFLTLERVNSTTATARKYAIGQETCFGRN